MSNTHLSTDVAKFRYDVFYSIDAIDPDVWDGVNNTSNNYLSFSFLSAFEKGMKASMSFRYLIFYNFDNQAVSTVVFQQFSTRTSDLLQNKVASFLAEKIKSTFSEKPLQILVCGNLFASGENGFTHTQLVSKKTVLSLINTAVSENFSDPKKSAPSFVLIKEFWPSFSDGNLLKENLFFEFEIDVNMVVHFAENYKNMAAYMETMNTKYRSRFTHVYQKSAAVRKFDFSAEQIRKQLPKIEKMYAEVISRVDYNLGVLDTQTFVYLKKYLGDNFVFVGYYLEDEFVGFSAAFLFDAYLDANFIGFENRYKNSHKLYQRMLLDFLELALHKNIREVRLGRTAETIKSSLGAIPVPMKLYARHRSETVSKLMRVLFASLGPSTFELRNPFKN
jgi:hypothetical protein